MIIGIGGPLQSGKSTLARYLVETKGFKMVSFARRLKEITAELYNWELAKLYTNWKDKPLDKPVLFGERERNKLAKIINAKGDLPTDEYTFNSAREALQVLGTEVLRKYDENFHVKEFKKAVWNWKENKLHDYAHFVCDDVRFENEMRALRSMGGKTFYVYNPRVDVASQHASETSLHPSDFDYIILNECKLSALIERFDRNFKDLEKLFLENDTTPNYNKIYRPDEEEQP